MKNLLCLTFILLFAITTNAQDCNMNENAQRHFMKAGIIIEEAKIEADYLVAVEELKRALNYAPNCPDIYFNIGMCYEKSADAGQPEKDIYRLKQAINNFKKYLNINPNAQDREIVQNKIYGLEVKYEKLTRKNKKSVYFGILGGLNISNYSYSSSKPIIEDIYSFSNGGIQIGMFVEFRLLDILSIQPGVNISGRFSGGVCELRDWNSQEYDLQTSRLIGSASQFYVDFPINLIFKYRISKSTWYTGIGPVISLMTSDDNTFYHGSDCYEIHEMPKTTISINFKLGYSIHKFFIELGYNAGMTNVSNDKDISLKNNYIFSSLGLKF